MGHLKSYNWAMVHSAVEEKWQLDSL
jgi:hypothetical protein